MTASDTPEHADDLTEAINIGLAALGYLNPEQHDKHWNTLERKLREIESRTRSERTSITPPTDEEIATCRDLYRAEIHKRMDTNHPSASPSTESMTITLHKFVEMRNARTVR